MAIIQNFNMIHMVSVASFLHFNMMELAHSQSRIRYEC